MAAPQKKKADGSADENEAGSDADVVMEEEEEKADGGKRKKVVGVGATEAKKKK